MVRCFQYILIVYVFLSHCYEIFMKKEGMNQNQSYAESKINL